MPELWIAGADVRLLEDARLCRVLPGMHARVEIMSAHYRDAVELPLFAVKDQNAATRLKSAFLSLLSDGQWHLGKSLQRDLGTNERVLRRIADASAGAVISSDKGYKLTAKASVEEIDHAERRLLSQARKMQERAVEIRKCRNSGGRAA